MRRQNEFLLIASLFLSSLLVSCGQFSPPQSCGAGGTANEGAFSQHFTEFLLYDESRGGSPLIDTEAGPTFFSDTPVSVEVDSTTSVEVRLCVEERRGGGEIKFDDMRTISEGTATISLATFEPGSYVLRVIVNSVLVRNLPFVVQ